MASLYLISVLPNLNSGWGLCPMDCGAWVLSMMGGAGMGTGVVAGVVGDLGAMGGVGVARVGVGQGIGAGTAVTSGVGVPSSGSSVL